MAKVSKKMDKKNKHWTDVKINAGGKTLEFSINENGYILIMNHVSDMQINFTSGEHFIPKITGRTTEGNIKSIDFITVNNEA